MAKDPVCGMQVDEKEPGAQVTYGGKTYVFCSAACKARFQEDPERYAESLKEKGHGCH